MVGDVKQSIYKFRLARPELFLEKFATYQKEDGSCVRVDLKQNFRSRHEGDGLRQRPVFTADAPRAWREWNTTRMRRCTSGAVPEADGEAADAREKGSA